MLAEPREESASKKRCGTQPLSKEQYALAFLLFDGGGIARKITSACGMSLCGCVIGESEHNLRRAVGGEYGYSANNEEWSLDNEGIPTTYILDVWDLSTSIRGQAARIVREAVGLATTKGVHKYFLIGGPPCPNLSMSGEYGGLLGFTGPVSVHFHVFPILMHAILALDPDAVIFIAIENARSMLDNMREYMRQTVGLDHRHQHQINTAAFSSINRNRIIFTSTPTLGPTVPFQQFTLEQDYERHPVAAHLKIATLMTPRRPTKAGNPIWTDSYYAIKHLVFSPSRANPERLLRMQQQICEEDGTPILPIDINDILPHDLTEIWHLYQQWCVSKTKTQIFSNKRHHQIQPAKDNDGNYVPLVYYERDTIAPVRSFNEGDQIYVADTGNPLDPGSGKISIEITFASKNNQNNGKTTNPDWKQARAFVHEIWPVGIDKVQLIKTDFYGYPDGGLSTILQPLFEALADMPPESPIRSLNAAERERLTGYDHGFDDRKNKEATVDDFTSGVITGNSFHRLAMIQALGGLRGAFYQFAQGALQSLPHTRSDLPTLRRLIDSYLRLADSVRNACNTHKKGRSAAREIQNLPYPSKVAPFIDAMLNIRISPQDCLQLELQPRAQFRCKNDPQCRELKEGFRQVIPINTSLEALAHITGRSKQQLTTHLKCNVPNTDASTHDLLSNTANAIAACVTDTGDSAQIAKAMFEKACHNCALGGPGLYRRISNPNGSGKERKTAAAQACKIFFMLATELDNCTRHPFNIITISPSGTEYVAKGMQAKA